MVKIMIFYNYKNKPHSSKKEVSLIPKINIKNIYIYCGAKGYGRPDPLRIISPRAQPRRKRPRITKEGPQLLGEIAEERHVLGTGVLRRKDNTPSTATFPVIPKRRD